MWQVGVFVILGIVIISAVVVITAALMGRVIVGTVASTSRLVEETAVSTNAKLLGQMFVSDEVVQPVATEQQDMMFEDAWNVSRETEVPEPRDGWR